MTNEEKTKMTEKGIIKEPVRVQTKISIETNQWLEKQAYEMGLNKSALINFAIEQYKREIEAMQGLTQGYPELIKQLQSMGLKT